MAISKRQVKFKIGKMFNKNSDCNGCVPLRLSYMLEEQKSPKQRAGIVAKVCSVV